jgi:hypothetical protein
MGFLILPNSVALSATTLEDSAAIQSGSNLTHIMAGPRNQIVKGTAGTSHTVKYNCTFREVTHAVLTNANLFKNGVNATQISLQYGSGPSVDSTTAVGSMTLVGIKSQDWVKTFPRTDTAFSVKYEHSSSSETWYGKIYLADDFSFGVPPQIVQSESRLERVRPLLGHRKYMTEHVIGMAFANLSQATVAAFRALPLYHPFFIYDENADLWEHKLEHVIIADPWKESRQLDGTYQLQLTVRRLRHYD